MKKGLCFDMIFTDLDKKCLSLYADTEELFGENLKSKDLEELCVYYSIVEAIKNNKQLDADEIGAAWFPVVKADVFISHDHKDKEVAMNLANWFTEKGITAFVDSVKWSSAYELLRQLDDAYCKKMMDMIIVFVINLQLWYMRYWI